MCLLPYNLFKKDDGGRRVRTRNGEGDGRED